MFGAGTLLALGTYQLRSGVGRRRANVTPLLLVRLRGAWQLNYWTFLDVIHCTNYVHDVSWEVPLVVEALKGQRATQLHCQVSGKVTSADLRILWVAGVEDVGIVHNNVQNAIKDAEGPSTSLPATRNRRTHLVEGVDSTLRSIIEHMYVRLLILYS